MTVTWELAMSFYDQLDHAGVLHAASLATVGGYLVGWLPAAATVLACIYYIVKIYESATVKQLITFIKSKPWR